MQGAALRRLVVARLTRLTALDLNRNVLGDGDGDGDGDGGSLGVAAGLSGQAAGPAPSAAALRELKLGGNRLGRRAAAWLAWGLSRPEQLRRLDLDGTRFGCVRREPPVRGRGVFGGDAGDRH